MNQLEMLRQRERVSPLFDKDLITIPAHYLYYGIKNEISNKNDKSEFGIRGNERRLGLDENTRTLSVDKT